MKSSDLSALIHPLDMILPRTFETSGLISARIGTLSLCPVEAEVTNHRPLDPWLNTYTDPHTSNSILSCLCSVIHMHFWIPLSLLSCLFRLLPIFSFLWFLREFVSFVFVFLFSHALIPLKFCFFFLFVRHFFVVYHVVDAFICLCAHERSVLCTSSLVPCSWQPLIYVICNIDLSLPLPRASTLAMKAPLSDSPLRLAVIVTISPAYPLIQSSIQIWNAYCFIL
jgi:hypothetical protein